MFHSKAHRLINAATALFFLLSAGVPILLAVQIKFHDGNYAAFYLGLGVLLECLYLVVHFGLKAILVTRAPLAEIISQVLGVLLMIPLGLIIFILVLLLGQSVRSSLVNEGVSVAEWVFGGLIFFLLIVPAFLICRNVVITFLKPRAEQTGLR